MSAGNGKQTTHARALSTTTADRIHIRPVHWLWTERIALGTLCLLGGREGVGKSLIAYTLAAQLTQGTLPGVYVGRPRDVLIVASEDSWEHTIVPRLMAAGADLPRVHRLAVHTADGAESALTLPVDVVELLRLVKTLGVALVVLDPLLSRLSTDLDTHKDADVRQALEPIVSFANAAGACVLGLIHVNKSMTTDPLTMLMGSRAFAAVARAVLFVMADPSQPEQRLLGQPKNNLGRIDLPVLSFRIAGEHVADTADGPVWTGKIHWLGDAPQTLNDAIADSSGHPDERSAIAEAVDWLTDYLDSGQADSAKIKKVGNQAGHSNRTLHRAQEKLKCVISSHGFPRKTYWALPSAHVIDDDDSARF